MRRTERKQQNNEMNTYAREKEQKNEGIIRIKIPRNEDTGIYNIIFRSVGVLVCWRFLTSKSTSKVIPATACWTRTVKNCSTEANTLPAHTRT